MLVLQKTRAVLPVCFVRAFLVGGQLLWSLRDILQKCRIRAASCFAESFATSQMRLYALLLPGECRVHLSIHISNGRPCGQDVSTARSQHKVSRVVDLDAQVQGAGLLFDPCFV